MDKHFDKQFSFLQFLVLSANKKQRVKLFEQASKEQVKCIIELAGNIINSILETSDSCKVFFRKQKTSLLYLWNARDSINNKKSFILSNLSLLHRVLDSCKPFFNLLLL